jgi:hypothetical protein
MRDEIAMLLRGQLRIERDEHASSHEHRVSGNEPRRLIRQDDRRPASGLKSRCLQEPGECRRPVAELPVGEPMILAIAIELDQAYPVVPPIDGCGERRRERRVAAEIDHLKQSVVQLHRRTENGEAPRWQGATTENIGNI